MDKKVGLVIEGGAMRSLFSAGILDFFLDKDFQVPSVITTSAGAYAALNYISGQRGRVVETNIEPFRRKEGYIGLKSFFKTGNLFDMDLLFDTYPNVTVPFDYDAFYRSDKRFLVSVTDCVTGEAVYYEDFGGRSRLMQIMRASNSLPLISRVVRVDGVPMLDGGMVEPIPVGKALREGLERLIVIVTREKNYRKSRRNLYVRLIGLLYRKYPAFVGAIAHRAQRYNGALDFLEKLEAEGRAFVLRPEKMNVANSETDPRKLMELYRHGYRTAQENYDKLREFVEGGVQALP